MPPTVFCLSSAEKGAAYMRQAKREGCYVILLGREKHADENWPREAIDEIHLIPTLDDWSAVLAAVNRVAAERRIDRVVALDDFDVECAAWVRERSSSTGGAEDLT